jgi:hypothetical protein
MEEYEEEYTNFDEEAEDKTNPQWRTLSPKERKLLMKNVFGNPDWYDEAHGSPVFEGGQANPMFEEISEKAGAPVREVKRYYAAWLKSQGFSPSEALRSNNDNRQPEPQASYSAATSPPPMGTVSQSQSSALPTLQSPPGDGGNEMWAMMQFLTQQQGMQMQQQQFQMQMSMEQRRLDQQKEGDTRREAMARDQQFMNQQMAFMRDMTKKAGDGDSFFDSEFKGIFKEKVLDSFMGDKDDGWKDSIKDVLGSDTLKAAVGGLGTALATRGGPQIPAGYDNPDYNPYAQTAMIQQPVQEIVPQQIVQPMAQPVAQPVAQPLAQPELDGVFFDDETQPVAQPVAQPLAPPPPAQFNDDEYRKILFSAFVEAMGPVAQDQQVLAALQQQVDVAVENTLREIPQALPQIKLQAMNEKLLLIRNLRDIGMGMMDLRERTPPGETPSTLVTAAVIGELRKNPEFYKIFAENTYDELMAKIEPFKHTGAVEQDFGYLLQPQVQEVCRPLLVAVTNDAQTSGMPSMPTLA